MHSQKKFKVPHNISCNSNFYIISIFYFYAALMSKIATVIWQSNNLTI